MRYSLPLIAALLVSASMIAQVSVRLSSNIASQPLWGPVGHDHARYYYLPDIETYYDVSQRQYYYYEDGRWIGSSQLPSRYSGYDHYKSYKVVINEPKPYQQHKKYKERYFSMRGRHDQELIRDSHDARYYVIKGHPEHNKWTKRKGDEGSKGKGKGSTRGKKQ